MTECLNTEVRYLRTFRQNGYNTTAFNRAMHKKQTDWGSHFTFPKVYIIQDQQVTWKFNIKTVHIQAEKSSHVGTPVKDDLGLKVSGVYSIPCEYRKVYTRQTV
jgi:hypothetical protein